MSFALSQFLPPFLRFGIKAGLAAVLAYAVSHWFGLPFALWAVASSVIAMQIHVGDSLHTGMLRITGTLLGAVIGVVFLLLTPKDPLSVGVAVFIVATALGLLAKYSTMYSPASIAAIIVLLTGVAHPEEGLRQSLSFGLMRVCEIVIGVGSSFAVSMLLWPLRLIDTLRSDLGKQFRECARILDILVVAFLAKQQEVQPFLLDTISMSVWVNHDSLAKARKHESIIYQYDQGLLDVQVITLDRTVECLRTMLETINDTNHEESRIPLIAIEIRALADAIMAALRHLGGDATTSPAPDLLRGLTGGLAATEKRLADMRTLGATREFGLHKVLQFFSFYQALRLLTEALLTALDTLAPTQGKAHD